MRDTLTTKKCPLFYLCNNIDEEWETDPICNFFKNAEGINYTKCYTYTQTIIGLKEVLR